MRALPRPVVIGGLVVGLLGVSSSAVLGTIVLGDPPDARIAVAAAFWRCLGGAVALAPFAWRVRRRHPVSRGDARLMFWSGVALAIHFALFLGSLAFTTVGSSTVLVTASPLFVALGGRWFLGEDPSRRAWVGMAVGLLGAVGLAFGDLQGLPLGPRALLGDAMALAAAVGVSAYLLLGRAARTRVHASTYAVGVYGTAAAVLLVACLTFDVPLWGYESVQVLGIAGLVLGPQLLGHTVFNTLLSTVPATTISMTALAEPVIATVMALFLLDQVPSAAFWLAAPVVLGGALLAIRDGTGPGGPRSAGTRAAGT